MRGGKFTPAHSFSVLSANCICGVGKILHEEWENAFCKL